MSDYKNSDARGGSPEHQKAHDKSMSSIDSKSKHLTSPSGGAKTLPGEQGEREKTKHLHPSSMPIVKKVAGGSNY